MARSLLLSAAQVILYVNGVMYGRITGFSWTSETPKKDIRGVDSTEPFELGITTSKITGSMSILRMSQDGGVEGAGMVAPLSELTREKYFRMLLIDLTSNAVLFQADKCSVDAQSWQIDARNLIRGSVTWSALTWNNEVRPVG